MAIPNPYPDIDLFSDLIKAKDAEIKTETKALVQALLDLGENELAARLLELGILNQNLQALHMTMLLGWINAS